MGLDLTGTELAGTEACPTKNKRSTIGVDTHALSLTGPGCYFARILVFSVICGE